jgi:hypothetical protein
MAENVNISLVIYLQFRNNELPAPTHTLSNFRNMPLVHAIESSSRLKKITRSGAEWKLQQKMLKGVLKVKC